MLRSFCALSLVACVFSLGVVSVAERASAGAVAGKAFRVGQFKTQHHGTYLMWQLNRSRLGEAKFDEVRMGSGDTQFGSEGAAMAFENGLIVRNFAETGVGSITVVSGPMFEAYLQQGGLHGRLGLPKTMPYLNDDSTGGKAQDFEGGRILWDAHDHQFVVRYDDRA